MKRFLLSLLLGFALMGEAHGQFAASRPEEVDSVQAKGPFVLVTLNDLNTINTTPATNNVTKLNAWGSATLTDQNKEQLTFATGKVVVNGNGWTNSRIGGSVQGVTKTLADIFGSTEPLAGKTAASIIVAGANNMASVYDTPANAGGVDVSGVQFWGYDATTRIGELQGKANWAARCNWFRDMSSGNHGQQIQYSLGAIGVQFGETLEGQHSGDNYCYQEVLIAHCDTGFKTVSQQAVNRSIQQLHLQAVEKPFDETGSCDWTIARAQYEAGDRDGDGDLDVDGTFVTLGYVSENACNFHVGILAFDGAMTNARICNMTAHTFAHVTIDSIDLRDGYAGPPSIIRGAGQLTINGGCGLTDNFIEAFEVTDGATFYPRVKISNVRMANGEDFLDLVSDNDGTLKVELDNVVSYDGLTSSGHIIQVWIDGVMDHLDPLRVVGSTTYVDATTAETAVLGFTNDGESTPVWSFGGEVSGQVLTTGNFAYNASTWNGSSQVPTCDGVRDYLESFASSINAGAPNGTGAKVHWSQLLGVPAGFADGTDATGGGGGGSGTLNAIKENNSAVGDADIVTLDFLGADFDLAESPDTEIQVVIAAALTRDAEWDTWSEIATAASGTLGEAEIDSAITRDSEAAAAYQPLDANELTPIAGLTSAADKGIYYTGPGTAATYDLSSYSRSLNAAEDAQSWRENIGIDAGSSMLSFLSSSSSAALATALTDELGTGKVIFSAGTLAVASTKTLTASNTLTLAGTDGSTLNVGTGGTLGGLATVTPGTGVATALAVNVGSAGAPVLFNGAGGTPSSLTLTNATGLPVAGITASTSTALGVGSVELGHATANTLTASSGVLSVEGVVVPSISSTNTLTNKRITRRTNSQTSASSLTPNVDNYDIQVFTALGANLTINADGGTPTWGDTLLVVMKDDGTPRTLTWNAQFRDEGGGTIVTTTTTSKWHRFLFNWNATDSKWGLVAYTVQP